MTTLLALTEIIAEFFSILENEYARDLIKLVGEKYENRYFNYSGE